MKRRRPATRERSKGVAVLELTLSLVFLIPLMMGTLDFGYYFYVGSAAQEAARQGLLQTVGLAGGCPGPPSVPTNCPAAVTNIVTKMASGTGTACASASPPPNVAPAASCYMNGPSLGLGTASNLTVTCECTPQPAAAPPFFKITVQVDFRPAIGFFRYLMPAGTAPGTVRYRAILTGA